MASSSPGIEQDGLRSFIRQSKLGDAAALQIRTIGAGRSNETYLVVCDGKRWVLRRPPRGPLMPSAHDVVREYQMLERLQQSGLPVPRVHACCADNSFIGAPFYLMDYVPGEVIGFEQDDFTRSPTQRLQVSKAFIDLLIQVGRVAWQDLGLNNFGRPEGYLQRQVARWSGQLDQLPPRSRVTPHLLNCRDWLGAHLPPSPATALVHGDFKLDNVIFTAPANVAALIDWEMATVGDPLTDLGLLLATWVSASDDQLRKRNITTVTCAEGFLSRQAMIEYYEDRVERQIPNIVFYQALALFKIAVALEVSYNRFSRGQSSNPMLADLEQRVEGLAELAASISAES